MIEQIQRLRERFDRRRTRGRDTSQQRRERQEKVYLEVEELRDLEQRLEQEEEMKDLEEQWNLNSVQSRRRESTCIMSQLYRETTIGHQEEFNKLEVEAS
mmetsp:Transcript_7002/g.14357  ORF Transcript_7002/g.14357 Transcript_7002/m.14357 type:complete len:100 (+) Transcript_7002:72-371(+)